LAAFAVATLLYFSLLRSIVRSQARERSTLPLLLLAAACLVLGNVFAASSYLAKAPTLSLVASYLLVAGYLVFTFIVPRLVWRDFRESGVSG